MNRSARDAEKRQAKLDAIDQQVSDGSLTIRTMTDKERRRFGIGDPDRPYKRFFVPGAKPGTRRAEEAYQQLARAVKRATGLAPSSRRIYRLEGKVGGRKARLEVGEPDPSGEDLVMAIFELEGKKRFAVCIDGADSQPAFRLDAPESSIVEFS
jgi:hypothetical protein